ncbi:CLUMA_CG011379, isoform A [Clunio marinus]|uniref:non-specific serine/threonine protein kinase n=1 Tax=Clunio marinus TaxID=568069 RepID=A0A1J1IE12_9DIPT|nr:CLUMA_CG011379, isoform A [Clunio marinus]
MNSIGLTMLIKSCICMRESVEISGSGFSNIDLVENSSTRRKYALKRITNHSQNDEKSALKEIEIIKKLSPHPNITKVIDFSLEGTADDLVNLTSSLNIVLPYYKNGSLDNYLARKSKLNDFISERQVLVIFIGICEAVRAIHECGYAHRDLKTGNVCLSETMEPVLVDFGSATEARVEICGQQDAMKLQDEAEEKCSLCYRAPELFQVESYAIVDERTDIWSLGCVLYALCFFKSPFDSVYERGDSVSLAVLSGRIPFPENSPYSQDLHELISFQLKTNPMERPFIYSVIEKAQDLVTRMENRI